jgi:Cupin-like domain
MLRSLAGSVDIDKLDRAAFQFEHRLLGHPALSLQNLARVIPALPKDRVMYSKGLLETGSDFEATFRHRPADRTLEETIEAIRVSDSYVMVRSPECDPSFADLHRQLIADVEQIMKARGVGSVAYGAQLYLFIASPNAVTPFHIDRNSTFLLQFQGSKVVSVFPQWDSRVVSDEDREAYVAHASTQLAWDASKDAVATQFHFKPGDALHIPFVAGHHVRNGSEDVSISMSIIFNTREGSAWGRALNFNHRVRPTMKRLGLAPTPVGTSQWRDRGKARLWSLVEKASGR